MTPAMTTGLTLFVLSLLLGLEVIGKVPATLHTPLMSATNAIHGVVVVGALLTAATATGPVALILVFLATAFGAMNVVGGYVVTDRMLAMFRKGGRPGGESS
jgi:NAD(P) transhydrogenase subunit alpha